MIRECVRCARPAPDTRCGSCGTLQPEPERDISLAASPFVEHHNALFHFVPATDGAMARPLLRIGSGLRLNVIMGQHQVQLLIDGLLHACANLEPTQPPAEPELDPILDAVRERRFALVLEMVVNQAIASGDDIALAMLHTLCAEHPLHDDGATTVEAPRDLVIRLLRTRSNMRMSNLRAAAAMPSVDFDDVVAGLMSDGVVRMDSRSYLYLTESAIEAPPVASSNCTVCGGSGTIAMSQGDATCTTCAPIPYVPTATATNDGVAIGKRSRQRVNRPRQEAARTSGRNCQTCDGGYIEVRGKSGRFLRTCSQCGGLGVRG